MQGKQTFIPGDKPKSWVLGVLTGLFGLLVAGPVAFFGAYFELKLLDEIGFALLVACWFAFVISWAVFIVGLSRGKYRNIQAQDWNKQLW